MTEENKSLENANNDLQESEEIADAYQEDGQNGESVSKIDYSAIERDDLAALKKEFPELSGISRITELQNPLRYGALRDLGLTPTEAYLATHGKRKGADNRSHLLASPTAASASYGVISEREMEAARNIFPDISDKEIRKLYKKVTESERKNYV